jgi:hypothetical protein
MIQTKNPLLPELGADGRWTMQGIGRVESIVETGPVRDWLSELGLPHDRDALDRLAMAHGFSHKHVRFIAADESETNFPGRYRLLPRRIAFTTDGIPLGLHLGYFIGQVFNLRLAQPGEIPSAHGDCLIGEGLLYDSRLAEAAWQGLHRGIFSHACAVLLQPPGTPQGTGGILHIDLTDEPGCPGALVLKFWEE